jgi:hypothetical protein
VVDHPKTGNCRCRREPVQAAALQVGSEPLDGPETLGSMFLQASTELCMVRSELG